MKVIDAKYPINNKKQFRVYKTRPSSLLNIPQEFKDVVLDIEPKLISFFGDDILLFSIVGSCAFEACISNWSDLDILIIVDHLDDEIMDFITFVSKEYNIHVGISIFTARQLDLKELDLKTRFYIYYIQQGKIIPSIFSEKLYLPMIDIELLKRDQKVKRNELLFALRRKLYDDKVSDKELFKLIVDILKIELSLNDVICATTNEVWGNSKKILGIDANRYISLSSIPNINRINLKKLGKKILWNITI